MIRVSRRQSLLIGGGVIAALVRPFPVFAEAPTVIEMRGSPHGEKVWFSPQGTCVPLMTTIRFINHDPGNSHTATAYHPSILGRQQRIPKSASPWDSDFLMPDAHFDVTLSVPGVYDFYCQPHEHAGMVGRIVVGTPDQYPEWQNAAPDIGDLPEEAFSSFPKVEDILNLQNVFSKEAI